MIKLPFTAVFIRAGLLLSLGLALAPGAQAQRRGGGGRGQNFVVRDPTILGNQQIIEQSLDPAFKNDVFTFARLVYRPSGQGGGRNWQDDFPDADLNITWRLFQVTSMKIQPGYKIINISAAELTSYPFVYVTATDAMNLSADECAALRKHLATGGFLMAEDFWGDRSWSHVQQEFRRIFPDRELIELGLDHPIFHSVFEFKYHPQSPSVGTYLRSGLSYDQADYRIDHDAHYYGIFDDKHRMMAVVCRNNHFGDGWEHEGDDHSYFDKFSEPQAYPMFINILFYAMTH